MVWLIFIVLKVFSGFVRVGGVIVLEGYWYFFLGYFRELF